MAAVAAVSSVLAVQLLLFPIPFGVWVQGAVLGLLGSLMAVGLGLTYRLNKVINFAQGDLGTAPAVLAVGLIAFSGVNYFLGLATGLVASVLLTATVEILVVRRFRRSPRLILTVATIGLSQLLVVVSLLIPRIWGQTPIASATVNFPWHFAWREYRAAASLRRRIECGRIACQWRGCKSKWRSQRRRQWAGQQRCSATAFARLRLGSIQRFRQKRFGPRRSRRCRLRPCSAPGRGRKQ